MASLKVPPGSQTGQTLRIRGKGIARKDRAAGNLYAHLRVMAPDGPVPEDVLEDPSPRFHDQEAFAVDSLW